ncbi:hypothetical protein Y032_0071g543 [Ancylostoma ceylanicum]|uniref:Uncharacterized protein n=1 Tax=Ancylostoma ceylanicum TaxID=53326 RepID=A0A016TW18_9BILA|nr:hypothetical protein Y032_0071g543 [Ancylostoma ceylanicum]
MYLKCTKTASKPVFRDGVCTSLLEQIYVQRRASPLISSIEQAKTCNLTLLLLRAASTAWSGSAPAPISGYVDPIKNQVFVTSVTFAVHCWNQRGEEVKNLLRSSA